MSFKILKNNCCGLDVHKTWIYACIGITDSFKRTEYKQARFSSFTKGLQELCLWLAKYNCIDVCMESTGKYWIPVFNVLEKNNIFVTLSHPKYTKPQKGNKTDRKDAKWICDLYMCGMVKPSFIPPADIRQLRDLVRYRFKLTCMITGEKNRAHNCLTVSNLKLDDVFSDIFGKSSSAIINTIISQNHYSDKDILKNVDKRCKASEEDILNSINGISWVDAQKERMLLIQNHIDYLNSTIKSLKEIIDIVVKPYEDYIKFLCTIPGVDRKSAISIISEIGTDMSQFSSHYRLVSWAGLAPGCNESAGKKKSVKISRAGVYIKPALVEVAHAAVTDKDCDYYAVKYKQISKRRGKNVIYWRSI